MKKNWFHSFSKSQASALAATVMDFGTLTLLIEVFDLYYVKAVAAGAVMGALTNFTINHVWAFSDAVSPKRQASSAPKIPARYLWRYALVSLGSLLLNTSLVFCFTELLKISYLIAKVIVALLVGWFYNYPLHRHFVWSRK